MLSSGGTCFASLTPSHFCGYWFFFLKTEAILCGSYRLPVSLVSRAQLLLATVSVCLGCSHISISVHLTSMAIASFLASFASFGLSWSYLGFSSWFAAWKWHSCQSGILQCITTNLSSLADWRNSTLQSLTCYCSGPAPSIPLLSVGWRGSCILIIPAHRLLFRTCGLIILSHMTL